MSCWRAPPRTSPSGCGECSGGASVHQLLVRRPHRVNPHLPINPWSLVQRRFLYVGGEDEIELLKHLAHALNATQKQESDLEYHSMTPKHQVKPSLQLYHRHMPQKIRCVMEEMARYNSRLERMHQWDFKEVGEVLEVVWKKVEKKIKCKFYPTPELQCYFYQRVEWHFNEPTNRKVWEKGLRRALKERCDSPWGLLVLFTHSMVLPLLLTAIAIIGVFGYALVVDASVYFDVSIALLSVVVTLHTVFLIHYFQLTREDYRETVRSGTTRCIRLAFMLGVVFDDYFQEFKVVHQGGGNYVAVIDDRADTDVINNVDDFLFHSQLLTQQPHNRSSHSGAESTTLHSASSDASEVKEASHASSDAGIGCPHVALAVSEDAHESDENKTPLTPRADTPRSLPHFSPRPFLFPPASSPTGVISSPPSSNSPHLSTAPLPKGKSKESKSRKKEKSKHPPMGNLGSSVK